MKRFLRMVGIVALVAAGVAAVAYAVLSGPASGAMLGVVTARGTAALSVPDQLGANEFLMVDEVDAPGDSWLVAYRVGMEGMPGTLLGYVHVGPGESRAVKVPLDPAIRLTPQAIVVLHADRGVKGRLEFAESRFETSPDKPYYIDGRPVETTATVALREDGDLYGLPDAPMANP